MAVDLRILTSTTVADSDARSERRHRRRFGAHRTASAARVPRVTLAASINAHRSAPRILRSFALRSLTVPSRSSVAAARTCAGQALLLTVQLLSAVLCCVQHCILQLQAACCRLHVACRIMCVACCALRVASWRVCALRVARCLTAGPYAIRRAEKAPGRPKGFGSIGPQSAAEAFAVYVACRGVCCNAANMVRAPSQCA